MYVTIYCYQFPFKRKGWTVSMDYPFHFHLSGETMALKPMWLCGL